MVDTSDSNFRHVHLKRLADKTTSVKITSHEQLQETISRQLEYLVPQINKFLGNLVDKRVCRYLTMDIWVPAPTG